MDNVINTRFLAIGGFFGLYTDNYARDHSFVQCRNTPKNLPDHRLH